MQYLQNKQITSGLVRLYDFYSLVVKNRKLTRAFAILYNQWIKIVQVNQPWSNLYIQWNLY